LYLTSNKKTLVYILIAFLFSVSVRFIWVYQFHDYDIFKFNNEFMINTNDGYYWAEGARDILAGFHQENDLSPIDRACSQLTAFLAKILPVKFETLIFYMPVFFASLMVIPILLLGKTIKNLQVGFIAALLASIAWSYYNRTMVGYYDTDFLNIVFPTFLLWSLILAFKTQDKRYLLLTGIEIVLYRWWYPQSYALDFSFLTLIFIYFLYKTYIKEETIYITYLMSFMIIGMIYLNPIIKFILIIILYLFYRYKPNQTQKFSYYVLGISFILFILLGGLSPIIGKLNRYVFREDISQTKDLFKLHFYTVMKTVREASSIPFEIFANRISGHVVTFLLAMIGYIWMLKNHKVMLLSLPLLGLGFLAYSSGLRFTIYAVPVLSLGIAYLIVKLSEFIKNIKTRYIFITVFTMLILIPNILHIVNYKVPTVFIKPEVVVLDDLKSKVNREDYVVAWWDYGYPIRYYSDVKTLIDGGKHRGKVNFPVSLALLSNQTKAVNISRLSVEYNEKRYLENKKNKEEGKKSSWQKSDIAQMMIDYHYKDPNLFIKALDKKDFILPKKTRDIYFYIPDRMFDILPTIDLFSNLDLSTGSKKVERFYFTTNRFKENANYLNLDNKILIDKKDLSMIVGRKKIPLASIIITEYDKDKRLKVSTKRLDPSSKIHMIVEKSIPRIILLDENMLNSTAIQLGVLQNYDKELFEPVFLTPLAKVYKVKNK